MVATAEKTYKVLIIDDSVDDRELYTMLLEKSVNNKFICDEADSAAQALELFKPKEYDCVLVDYNLPDSDGITLLRKLLDIYQGTIALVLLTGQGDEKLAVRAMKSGAHDYLPKSDLNSLLLINVVEASIEKAKLMNELEESRRELVRSNDELENFAYIASHDLREPLRKVVNFGKLLKEKHSASLNEEGQSYIEIMHSASLRMRSLLDALLAYSRVATKEMIVEELDLHSMFKEIVSDLGEKVGETRAQIVIADDLPKLELEPELIRDLFQNLIANALKFKKEDIAPIVTISAEKLSDTNWQICVKDNGLGFDMELKEKIFEQFMRVHGKDEYEGHGMGLATCQKIAKRHQGKITANSNLGEGSSFFVVLPEKQKNL